MFRVYYAPVLMLTFHETATVVDLEIFVVKYFCGLRKPRKKNTKYILQRIHYSHAEHFCSHNFTAQLASYFA